MTVIRSLFYLIVKYIRYTRPMTQLISKRDLIDFIKTVPIKQRPAQWRTMSGRNTASLLTMAEEIGAVPRRLFRTRAPRAMTQRQQTALAAGRARPRRRRAGPKNRPRPRGGQRKVYPSRTEAEIVERIDDLSGQDIARKGKIMTSQGQWYALPSKYDHEGIDDGTHSLKSLRAEAKKLKIPLSYMENGKRKQMKSAYLLREIMETQL